jgi:sialate O-acetylesterase
MEQRILIAVTLAVAICLAGPQARADVKPNELFTDGMVLQRGVAWPIWGTADPGEQVSVAWVHAGGFGAVETQYFSQVNADKDGKWRIDLRIPVNFAGGPDKLTIKGKNTITLKDVYVGDVWICSGQSNMEWQLRNTHNAAEAIAKSKNPKIRLFTVPKNTSEKPLDSFKGDPKWQECNPDTVKNFTAVGYFFGRDLQKALDVPIGLIHTSWGGTVAEAWTKG